MSATVNMQSQVDRCVADRLNGCSYSFYFSKVDWDFRDGTLELTGYVPTFHMKQVLQTVLRGVDHVEELVNNVDVLPR